MTEMSKLQRNLFKLIDDDGNTNANLDYSSTPTKFYVQPPPHVSYELSRLIVFIRSKSGARWDRYGRIGELTNGIFIKTYQGDVEVNDLTSNEPIRCNADWARYCHDTHMLNDGSGDDFISVRWSFYKSGSNICLDGTLNERLVVIVNDDFSGNNGLKRHNFDVQGVIKTQGRLV